MKERIQEDMKSAMRSKDSDKLGVIRLIMAAIKQREVDERISLDDTQIIVVLDKMLKQRRDSLNQFQKANRQDLADIEANEISIIEDYMPPALDEDELLAMIEEAIASTGASSPKDMGKVIGMIKPKVQGRADMGAVSGKIKNMLTAL